MPQKTRFFLKAVSLFLVCVLFAWILPPHADALDSENMMHVGLYYGNNVLPTANLANEVGSGYRFGYFDGNDVFHTVGRTALEKITVCKDKNLYHASGTFYESVPSASYRLVGAYHLQPAGTYASFDEAAEAAKAYPYGFPAYVNGGYVVRFEFYSTSGNASADAANYGNVSVVGASATCYTVVDTATGEILFEFDDGADSYLGIMPVAADGELAQTWFKGYRYYGGFQYMRRAGNDLTVVNIVSEDLYVAGVLPYEFVASGSLESLKAGAVAIRTFARVTNKHASSGFDICNTTDCQVYRGVYGSAYADKILQAVEETAGECAYYDGVLIEAVYFSSDGGHTEDSGNTWGTDYPYLRGKEDPYEETISFAGQNWSYHVSAADLQSLLQSMGKDCGTVVDFAVTELTENGNVNEIVITDSRGNEFKYRNDNVRILQNLSGVTYMSRRFTIQDNSKPTGQFFVYDGSTVTSSDSVSVMTAAGETTVSAPATVITSSGTRTIGQDAGRGDGTGWTIIGSGYGHNVGMSQWGAYAMGKLGYTYDEILKFYYSGITIE